MLDSEKIEHLEIKLKQIEFAYHIALNKLEEILKASSGEEANIKLMMCHLIAEETLSLLKR
jgi:hypothetical protein